MVNGDSQHNPEFFDRHLSKVRLKLYVDHCAGDVARAIDLYRWNAELAGAFMIDIGHFEVALRNILDERLTWRHTRLGRRGDWLDDDDHELGRDDLANNHRQPFRDINDARVRVTKNKRPTSHDQIISETGFGLWQQLVSKGQTRLWPDLVGAFRFAPDRRQSTVSEKVARVRTIRNRIGHHHRVWAQPWESTHDDLLMLAWYIDPALSAWIGEASGVLTLRQRP